MGYLVMWAWSGHDRADQSAKDRARRGGKPTDTSGSGWSNHVFQNFCKLTLTLRNCARRQRLTPYLCLQSPQQSGKEGQCLPFSLYPLSPLFCHHCFVTKYIGGFINFLPILCWANLHIKSKFPPKTSSDNSLPQSSFQTLNCRPTHPLTVPFS